MVDVPWPVTNNPGLKPQEGTGKLVNVFAEPRGDGKFVWRRAPGASVFARVPSSGSASLEFNANARSATLFSTFFELLGSSTYQYAGGTTQEIVYPSGTDSGDVVFILSAAHDNTVAWTSPSGFTPLTTSSTTAFMGYSLYYKASTGESTVAFPAGSSAGANVSLVWTIRGAMSTAPIVDTAALSSGGSGDPHPTSFTNTTADSLIMTVAWVDDDNASAVSVATTAVVAGATTFNCGGALKAVTTGTDGSAGGTVMVAFRPMATTGVYNFSTGNSPAWSVTGGDDEWAAQTFTLRHD